MHPRKKGGKKIIVSIILDDPPRNVIGNSNRDTGL
jgi:hypothetical protein